VAPGRALDAAGMAEGGPERRAIDAALERLGRSGQPVGDFTYGVAPADGLAPLAALKSADEALNAAKDAGGRGTIRVVEGGTAREWTPPADAAPAPLPAPAPRDTTAEVERLESRLTERERRLFRESSFRDPLTLTRTYDYVPLKARDWDREYARGGEATLLSARNLKQINDLLGHEAGDRYLSRLGGVLRQAIARARRRGLDVQEPVRVASKEFLLVGRDASAVAEAVRREVAKQFAAGRILPEAEVARLRGEAARRGLVPPGRIPLIGTLRTVSEPIAGRGGRADVLKALDRAFVRLETVKRAEDSEPPAGVAR
ncbi:MAG: GGDEF domain-containing protein, partial [Elusimicrobia bacterium]|nr:GGDEF domain-containing protein [Elusimicrobiota bacterium]